MGSHHYYRVDSSSDDSFVSNVQLNIPKAGGRKPDQRGTLTVPNRLLREVGMRPGSIVYVVLRKNETLALKKNKPHDRIDPNDPGFYPCHKTTYTVDYAGNVRITKKILKLIGNDNSTYDFEKNGDEVIVKVHK